MVNPAVNFVKSVFLFEIIFLWCSAKTERINIVNYGKGDVVMKIKNFAIGALAAAMLFTGTSVMEAAVYNTSASRLPTDIDSRCGRTEAFLLKKYPL